MTSGPADRTIEYTLGGPHRQRTCTRCDRTPIARGLCATHWRADRLGIVVADDLVGQPSGFGVLGEMTRGPDFVVCHECGQTFRNLGAHLRFTHDESAEQYRDRHQIAGRDQLMCGDLIAKTAADSLERVGTVQWQRFTAARDGGGNEAARAAASQSAPRLGARQRLGSSRRGHTGPPITRHCTVCAVMIPGTSRDRTVCSQACWHESKVRAAGRRSANRLGETENFERHGIDSDRRLRLAEMALHLGIAETTFRKWLSTARFRPHDGRQHWIAYWTIAAQS